MNIPPSHPGDAEVTELYRKHYQKLRRYLRRRGAAEHEAQNFASDGFLAVYANWSLFEEDGFPVAYAYQTARRLLGRHIQKRRDVLTFDGADPDNPEHDQTDRVSERLDLASALRRLPSNQHEVIYLFFIAGLTEMEIALVIDCPIGTVKSRKAAALAKLRKDLGEDYREGGEEL